MFNLCRYIKFVLFAAYREGLCQSKVLNKFSLSFSGTFYLQRHSVTSRIIIIIISNYCNLLILVCTI